MLMDNFHFDVTGMGTDALADALRLALKLSSANKTPVSHYAVDPKAGMGLFWADATDERRVQTVPLPCPVGVEEITALVTGWLRTVDYGPEPDHDGSNTKGWRVYNDPGGARLWGSFYGIVAVQPQWAEHGK